MTDSPVAPRRLNLRGLALTMGNLRGLLALAVVVALGIMFTPRNLATGHSIFLTWQTQSDILFEYSEYGLLACGMTLVILTGGIDLSVGSIVGFAATLFALLLIGHGWGVPAAAAACLAAGGLAGLLNGVLISRFRMQPFVATLAMMVAARGAAKVISGGIKVQPAARDWYALQQGSPPVFDWLTRSLPVIRVQPATLLFLLAIVTMTIVVRYTSFGRRLYAVGGSEEAARLSGIRVPQVKIWAYSLCAFFAALAGLINASRISIGDPEAGFTYELDAIAAVVIGGTTLNGGQGGMGLTFVGVLIIAYINKILSLNAVPEPWRLLAKGLIIVVAVLIQQRRKA
jgi:ribose transport system permease protein